MTEDALAEILKNEKVSEYIENNKEALKLMFFSLVDAVEQVYPNDPPKPMIICSLMWEVLKWEKKVMNVFILHGFDMSKWEHYGPPVGERIISDVLEALDVDLNTIRLKRKDEK